MIRKRISEMISENNGINSIVEADNKKEALHLFREYHPDIVILDIPLNSGDGIQILKKMKEIRSESIVIVISSNSNSLYKEKCKNLGADFFFDVAYEFDKISAVFDKLKKNSRRGTQNNSKTKEIYLIS